MEVVVWWLHMQSGQSCVGVSCMQATKQQLRHFINIL